MNMIKEILVLVWLAWAVSAIAAVERTGRPEALYAGDAGYVHGAHCMDSGAF